MRYCSALVILTLLAPAVPLVGETTVPGAKDLFYDPAQGSTLGVQVPAPTPPATSRSGGTAPTAKPRQSPAMKMKETKKPPSSSGVLLANSDTAASTKNRGLRYWIELEEPNGESQHVSNQYVFRSGQRIRLHFESNADGRILLIQLGASRTATRLFPDPRKELTDDRLKAGEDRVLPSDSHWFRFDSNAGTERLIAMFAGEAELEQFPVKPEMGPTETKALMQSVSHVQGSKDLVIETETRTASQVGTYGVNLKGEPVILEILLQHR
jgi:Domain of unknown function (DUF4384)